MSVQGRAAAETAIPRPRASARAASPAPSSGPLSVLPSEDDAGDAESVRNLLAEIGPEIVFRWARSLDEARVRVGAPVRHERETHRLHRRARRCGRGNRCGERAVSVPLRARADERQPFGCGSSR